MCKVYSRPLLVQILKTSFLRVHDKALEADTGEGFSFVVIECLEYQHFGEDFVNRFIYHLGWPRQWLTKKWKGAEEIEATKRVSFTALFGAVREVAGKRVGLVKDMPVCGVSWRPPLPLAAAVRVLFSPPACDSFHTRGPLTLRPKFSCSWAQQN